MLIIRLQSNGTLRCNEYFKGAKPAPVGNEMVSLSFGCSIFVRDSLKEEKNHKVDEI